MDFFKEIYFDFNLTVTFCVWIPEELSHWTEFCVVRPGLAAGRPSTR